MSNATVDLTPSVSHFCGVNGDIYFCLLVFLLWLRNNTHELKKVKYLSFKLYWQDRLGIIQNCLISIPITICIGSVMQKSEFHSKWPLSTSYSCSSASQIFGRSLEKYFLF
ncbi:hypothetical protein SRHO_G00240920 [Serrasalmus rhombeus]